MKFSRLVLFIAFSAFATSVCAQTPSMPDYSKWEKELDHSLTYSSKGREVQVRDEHYEFVNKEKTEGFSVLVFYSPDTGKAWFALYVHEYADPQKSPEAYLYEAGENGAWIFDQDVSKSESINSILKSRYDLVEIKQ